MNDDSPRVSGDMHGFPSLEVLRQNKTIKPNRKIIYNSETDKRSPPIRQKEKQKEKKKTNCGHRIATDAGGAPMICMYK